MINDLKVYLRSLKGKCTLAVAGISTGAIVMSGLSGCTEVPLDSVDDPSEIISEVPSEIAVVISEEPSEEISEEVSEEMSEVVEDSPYKQVPEELLDEDGIYHPEEVTADMLRERFADVDDFVEEHGFVDMYTNALRASIMRANYSFMSDETFKEIVNEYNVDVSNCEMQMYYDGKDYPAENIYFDPYLQYEAAYIYDLCDTINKATKDGDAELKNECTSKLNSALKGDEVPFGTENNLYDRAGFNGSTAIYEMQWINGISKTNNFLDYYYLFGEMNQKVKVK